MFHPAVRKGRERRSPWRGVGNPSKDFRDAAAPNGVVARELIETTIDANVLDGHHAVGATDAEYIISGRLEDWALAHTGLRVGAGVDGLLEDRVWGGIPTVLEVGMAGVSYGVACRQDEGAVVVLEIAGVGHLLEEECHKPDGVTGRAGASFLRADGVRDMVLEVGARNVLAIPA